ncbi:hypothetical protein [Candidatus Endoriftia persephonae]|jgi:hypothetical protein|nr:hypothetical protein [Candidatus Endoriftia persephone]KRT56502.1 hypothetical protein Ga0074115_1505 [endosymbiont of Ridgeia piscesae]KRT57531.1 hypothetical protein Ga0076813_11702 [endosymbiont of Ridgeia piscesae]USF88152.1 antitermination protein NusG [Candidatus Endoriftia persephone]
MITKLLLTLGVIGIAWLVLRQRARRVRQIEAAERSPQLSAPAKPSGMVTPRLAAYGLVIFMILVSSLFLYLQWRDEYRIVTVRVVNTQTGESLIYEARRGDVEGRHFETLDGRVITVADVERIEMGRESRQR